MTTIEEARQRVQDERRHRDGIVCPCCEQLCKTYRRVLNAQMARFLIWLAKYSIQEGGYNIEDGGRWVGIDRFPLIQRRPGGGDFAKLRFWELIEEMGNDDSSKRTSGIWRITPLGMAFATGKMRVPAAVFIYNNKLDGKSDVPITIHQALGTKFSYDALWHGALADR